MWIEKIDKDKNIDFIKKGENIYWYNYFDKEITNKNNIICQHSASNKNSVSVPYCPLFDKNKNKPYKSDKLLYDLSFVGFYHDNRKYIIENIISNLKNKNILLCIRKKNMWQVINNDIDSNYNNNDDLYYNSIINSKLCLCPPGYGFQSIRFYEVLDNARIPLLIIKKKTKLPLDWIINWKNIIPIIYEEDIEKKYYINIINNILSRPNKELVLWGIRCKYIFDKFLNIFNNENVLKNFKKAIQEKYPLQYKYQLFKDIK